MWCERSTYDCALYVGLALLFGGFFDIKIANNANTTMDSFLIWANLIPIHNTHMTQMKENHLWLDRSSFNWMKLRFIKRELNEKILISNFLY